MLKVEGTFKDNDEKYIKLNYRVLVLLLNHLMSCLSLIKAMMSFHEL